MFFRQPLAPILRHKEREPLIRLLRGVSAADQKVFLFGTHIAADVTLKKRPRRIAPASG
jgi:hypothetical protein